MKKKKVTTILKNIFLEKVHLGLSQSENGKVISKLEAKKQLKKWLK